MIFVFQAEEEARSLQKKIQAIENDLDQTQEALMQVNAKLDEKDKSLQIVSTYSLFSRICHLYLYIVVPELFFLTFL